MEKENSSALGRRIARKNLTFKDVAYLVDTTPQNVQRWIDREVSPSLIYAARLQKLLGNSLNVYDMLSTKQIEEQKEWMNEKRNKL